MKSLTKEIYCLKCDRVVLAEGGLFKKIWTLHCPVCRTSYGHAYGENIGRKDANPVYEKLYSEKGARI